MIKVQIDRKKWLRGSDEGALRNESGAQCCLGFVCKKLGLTNNEIFDVGMPDDVLYNEIIPEFRKMTLKERLAPLIRVEDARNRQWVEEAATINDDFSLPGSWYDEHEKYSYEEEHEATEKMREEKLIKLFAKNGFELKFIG